MQRNKLGNTLWKLKLLCSNIMLNYGENPYTLAETIPENYVQKNLRLEDLEAMEETWVSMETYVK